VDEDGIVVATRQLLVEHDDLSVECLEYTHLAKQHHVTTGADVVEIVDNNSTVSGEQSPLPVHDSTEEDTNLVFYGPVTYAEMIKEKAEVPFLIIGTVVCPNTGFIGPLNEVDTLLQEGDVLLKEVEVLVEQLIAPVLENVVVVAPDVAVVKSAVVAGPSRNFTICQDVVEVKNHRRVHKHMQEAYVYSVVAEIKNRLGVPKNNAANLLAVRRMANQIMVKHGVRPTHIRRAIELIVAGVFIPDDYDIQGARIRASNIVKDRVDDFENASPKTFWQSLWKSFSRGPVREEKG